MIRATMQKPGVTLTLVILGAILLTGWAMRSADLDADPPETLSWSQGPYTDGGIVGHNARNHALFNTWVRDHANDIYFWPVTNFATGFVYSIAGVGRGQAALANTIFGTLSILLLGAAFLRVFGRGTAILCTLFATFHYYLVMYDRLAIAEPAMIFLLSVSVFCFGMSERRSTAAFAAGFFGVLAVLIGKAHAMYFPVALVLALLIPRSGGAGAKRERNRRLLIVLAGMAIATAIWAAVLGVPHGDYLFSQGSRASFEKHGEDPRQAAAQVWINLFHMGVQTNSVQRMPVLFVLAMTGLLGVISKTTSALRKEPPFVFLMLVWLVLGWATIATQHTPSPRYLLALLPPMIYFASRPLIGLLNDEKPAWSLPREPRAMYASAFLLYFFVYQALAVTRIVNRAAPGLDPLYVTLILQAAALPVFGALLFAVSMKSRKKRTLKLDWTPGRRRALAGTLVIAFLLIHGGRWASWKMSNTHYMRDASIDIGSSLGEGAALIGPYAPTIGLDNALPAYPFLGRYEHPGLLYELQPTHMVIVTPFEQAAIEERYPSLASAWTFAGLYPIRMPYADKIVIYRLPQTLDGKRLNEYKPSALEHAVDAIRVEAWDTALPFLEQFLDQHPDHAEGIYLLAVCRFGLSELDAAISLAERAVVLRPERPLYHFRLGDYYARAGQKDHALRELETTCRLDPDDQVFRRARDTMRANQ